MARLHVGLPHLEGSVSEYAAKFDTVELRFEPGSVPRPATLRGWRKSVNPGFTFCVCLPRIVGDLTMTKEMDQALEEAIATATTLEARCLLLTTSPDVRPTQQTITRLEKVSARLPRPSVVLAWEPHGIWERKEILQTAKHLGMVPVVDAAHEPVPPGSVVYTRLRSLGGAQRPSQRAIQRLAADLMNKRDAWVIVEHAPSAKRVRAEIIQAMSEIEPPSQAPSVTKPSPGRLRAEDEEQ